MRIQTETTVQVKPWVVVAAAHQHRVRLSVAATRVRVGTPLKPTPTGWEPARAGESAWYFAGDYVGPGEVLVAWRNLTVDVGEKRFAGGTRLVISDVDESGFVTFRPDEHGPHVVDDDTLISLFGGEEAPPSA